MRSFEIVYPVVGSVKFSWGRDKTLSLADTYFEPLMEASFAALLARDPSGANPPRLLRMWQERTEAFDVEGGVFELDPNDGLLDLLEASGGFLPELDTQALETGDGASAPSLEDARQALVFALRDAILAASNVRIEDIP
jgi:hypothetical protein